MCVTSRLFTSVVMAQRMGSSEEAGIADPEVLAFHITNGDIDLETRKDLLALPPDVWSQILLFVFLDGGERSLQKIAAVDTSLQKIAKDISKRSQILRQTEDWYYRHVTSAEKALLLLGLISSIEPESHTEYKEYEGLILYLSNQIIACKWFRSEMDPRELYNLANRFYLVTQAFDTVGGKNIESMPIGNPVCKALVLRKLRSLPGHLEIASPAVKADKELVLAAVENGGLALEDASDNLRGDREIVLAAVQNNGYALEYARSGMKADREIVKAAVKKQRMGFTICKRRPPSRQRDRLHSC